MVGGVEKTIGGLRVSAAAPRVVGSVQRVPQAAELAHWRAQGLEIAELRLDKLTEVNAATIAAMFAAVPEMPIIATLRAPYEGGAYQGEEQTRGEILANLPAGDAVDVELAAVEILPKVTAAAKAQGRVLILSRHNFSAADSAAQLDDAMAQAQALGADIFKCACVCTSAETLQILVDFAARCAHAGQLCVVIGMDDGSGSDFARQARAELPRRGSCLAFAKLEGEGSAPGQLSLAETAAACRQHGAAREI